MSKNVFKLVKNKKSDSSKYNPQEYFEYLSHGLSEWCKSVDAVNNGLKYDIEIAVNSNNMIHLLKIHEKMQGIVDAVIQMNENIKNDQ